MRNSRSYLGIDILKHTLAITVIIQHMHSSTRYSDATNLRIAELTFLAQGAVLGFFLISGYFFHVKTRAGWLQSISEHVQRYAKRLLIPFILFSAIYATALIAMRKLGLHEALKGIGSGYGVGMQMYFLSFLFVITMVAGLLGITVSSQRSKGAILLFGAVLLGGLALRFPTQSATGSSYYLLPLYGLSFLIGRSFAWVQEHAKNRFALLASGIALGCFVLGLKDFRFYFLAVCVIAFSAAYYLSAMLPNRRMPGSGGVYLLHTPIVNYAVSAVLVKAGVVQLPNALLSVVCTYALCLTFTLWFIKTLPRFGWILLE